jgi:nucleoside-diphosphate-sugar epimerase
VYVESLNCVSIDLVSINHLVYIFEEIVGVKFKRRYNLSAPKGVNGRNSDNTLIEMLFNWEPSTRLRDGLEKTYRWIHDQMTQKSSIQSGSFAPAAR